MRRIREKLEGKDFNVQHRMDVSEQVSDDTAFAILDSANDDVIIRSQR